MTRLSTKAQKLIKANYIDSITESVAYTELSQPIRKNKDTAPYEELIILYLYKETSEEQNLQVEALLQSNNQLQQFFYELAFLKKQLDHCQTRYTPSAAALDKIIKYAKS